MRNLEYARMYRKRTNYRRTKERRTGSSPQADSDNEFLSAVFGTISFGADKVNGDVSKSQKEGQAPQRGESQGAAGIRGANKETK